MPTRLAPSAFTFLLCLFTLVFQACARPSSEARSTRLDGSAVLRTCRRQLSMGSSNCKAMLKRWYYDSAAQMCRPFGWTGCGGNDNRFESREECEAQCQGVPPCRPTRPRPAPQDCSIFKAIGINDGCPGYYLDCQERPSNGSCGPMPHLGPLPKDCRLRTITTPTGCPRDVVTCVGL